MQSNFNKAIEKYDLSDFSRWLLPDGQWLAVNDYDDHRIIGEFCKNSWRDFIFDGACSVHYDPKARYCWIRTSGLSCAQRQAWQEIFETFGFRVDELKVDFYIFESPTDYDMEEEIIEDLAELYLTDTVAYQLEKQYLENEDY